MNEPRTNWMIKGILVSHKDIVGAVARLRGKTMGGLLEEIIAEWHRDNRAQIQKEIAQCTTEK